MLKRLLGRKPSEASEKGLADEITEQLQNSISYKRVMGFYDTWAECERFRLGDQWPPPTKATKDLPRPVLNIVERIVDMKVSAVLSEPPSFVFVGEVSNTTADDSAAELFTAAARMTWEANKVPRLNERTCDIAAVMGTAFRHWYWDQSVIGGNVERGTAFIGDIRGEVLGPDKVHLGNPQQKNINKQPWIILVSTMPYTEFVDMYRETAGALGTDINSIKPDKDSNYLVLDASKKDIDGKSVTVIHRYWKVHDGLRCYICYAVVAGGKLVRYEKPLYEGDLYPITRFIWKDREDVAYGISEVAGLIPNQKQINRMLAIYLLSLYSVGMPKISYNPSYVNLRDINVNIPGSIIPDNSPNGAGWRYVQPAPMPGDIPGLLTQLTAMSKDISGANEAFLGESAPQNATAIMMLQKQANAPIQKIRDRFYDVIEDDLQIWALFYKRFYSEARLVKLTKDNGVALAWFRGTDYYDLRLFVRVEAGGGSAYSESLMLTELKELLRAQIITPEEYLEYLPKQVLPFSAQIIERRKERQQRMQQQMMQQASGLMGQIGQDTMAGAQNEQEMQIN